MVIGTYNLSKETILNLMHGMVDGRVCLESLSQAPDNGLAKEIARFITDYTRVKPGNLRHNDIRVLS